MGGLSSFFNFGGGGAQGATTSSIDLPILFPLAIKEADFVRIDVINIYKKILTDVAERSEGLSEDDQALLWDNCLASEKNDGLISLLAKAMFGKKDLFLVIDKATKVLREATREEQTQIQADYAKTAGSKVGAFVTFKNFDKTDMISLYSALEYATIGSLNKGMNLSRAIQLKIEGLRSDVGAFDSADAIAQAQVMVTGLSLGKDLLMDSKDLVETAKPDLTSVEKGLTLINQKRAFYLNLPASYITGELSGGLGDSGKGDSKAVERGLKPWYFSILKPVVKQLFGTTTKFKSDDQEQLSTSLEALKTFDITSDEHLSAENKTKVVNRLFGLDENEKGDAPEKPAPGADPAAGLNPNVPPKTSPPPPAV